MGVETEPGAIVIDRADPHGSLYGERITPGLTLEAQFIESISYFWKLPQRVKDHQIHDALTLTSRHRCAADMFHDDARNT